MTSFLFLLKNGLVYPVWFDRAYYAPIDSFFVAVLQTLLEGTHIWLLLAMLLIDIVVV